MDELTEYHATSLFAIMDVPTRTQVASFRDQKITLITSATNLRLSGTHPGSPAFDTLFDSLRTVNTQLETRFVAAEITVLSVSLGLIAIEDLPLSP